MATDPLSFIAALAPQPVVVCDFRGATGSNEGIIVPNGQRLIVCEADIFFHGDLSGGQLNLTRASTGTSWYQKAGSSGSSGSDHWSGFHVFVAGDGVKSVITVGTFDVMIDGYLVADPLV